MGKTITEKILARAAGTKEVSPGDYIEVTSRCFFIPGSTRHVGLADKVFDPKRIAWVDGHTGSTASNQAAQNRSSGLEWAKRVGIPMENIYALGRQGIEHMVAADNAWARPGEVFFEGNNGHTTALGAFGAFAITLSYGSAAYMMTGKTWIRVPDSVKFIMKGTLPKGVYARDVFEYVLGQIGPSACPGMVMEWVGPLIDEMDMDARITLTDLALFTGAWTGIINPDQKTIDYVRTRTDEPFEPLVSDDEARYAKVFEFDVSNLVPQIVPPPKRYIVKNVTELEGTPINRGFVGSCANSRMADLRLAAQVLRGKKLHPEVILNITPGTVKIYQQAIHEGLVDIFIDAGCLIASPNCGMCWAANTPLAAADVCISTGTCNYPGRMGSKDAEIYLGNPALAAASCIEGKIVDPRRFL